MILKSLDGNVTAGSFFKPVAIGYAIGMGTLMLPMLLLMMPTILLAPAAEDGPQPFPVMLSMFILLPIVIILQGMMFGAMVVLGLSIYGIKRPIQISNRTETISELPTN